MSLVFGALIPNDPHIAMNVLYQKNSSPINQAISELEGELYFMNPDTLVLITAHGDVLPNAITIHMAETLQATWPEGTELPDDVPTQFHTDMGLAARLKEHIDQDPDATLPVTIAADVELDHRISAPLTVAMQHLIHNDRKKVLVVSTGKDTSMQENYDFGQYLYHLVNQTNKRVAVLATGHFGCDDEGPASSSLCHLAETHAQEGKLGDLVKVNQSLLEQSGQDVMYPLSILLGVTEGSTGVCTHTVSGKEQGNLHLVTNCTVQ